MIDLERIKEQLVTASPGPWEWQEFNIEDEDEYECYLMAPDTDGIMSSIYEGGAPVCADPRRNRANLQLISAAPTVIARLVAELDAARAFIEEAEYAASHDCEEPTYTLQTALSEYEKAIS